MAKLALFLTRIGPTKVNGLLFSVISGMRDNVHFPDPPVPVFTMQALHVELSAVFITAVQGGRLDKRKRYDLGAHTRRTLQQQADYVTLVSKGDAIMLISSGFGLARPNMPVSQVSIPQEVRVRAVPSTVGTLEARWKTVHGAHGYIVLRSDETTNGAWEQVAYTTRITYVSTGLVGGRKYWFAVRAVGANSESAISNPGACRAA